MFGFRTRETVEFLNSSHSHHCTITQTAYLSLLLGVPLCPLLCLSRVGRSVPFFPDGSDCWSCLLQAPGAISTSLSWISTHPSLPLFASLSLYQLWAESRDCLPALYPQDLASLEHNILAIHFCGWMGGPVVLWMAGWLEQIRWMAQISKDLKSP